MVTRHSGSGRIGEDRHQKWDVAEGGAVQLTLARRYLDDSDPRRKWAASKVAEKLLEDERGRDQPWRARMMRLRCP